MEWELSENIAKVSREREIGATTTCPMVAFIPKHPLLTSAVILNIVLVFYLLSIGPRLQKISRKGNRILYKGRFLFYYVTLSLGVLLLIPIFLLRPKNVANLKMVSPIGWAVSFLLGIEWELRGLENLDESAGRRGKGTRAKSAVLIANHQSSLDSLGLIYFCYKLSPVAATLKKEIFYAWPVGLTAYLCGSIFIDRSGGRMAANSLVGCAIRAAEEKIRIFIYPEGTRNNVNRSWDGDSSKKGLLPFKRGAFMAAVAAGIPVVPIIHSPYTFLDEKRLFFGRGRAIMKVLPAISTEGYMTDNIEALMAKCHKIMSEEYQSLMKEVLSSLPPDHFARRKKKQ